MGKTRRLPPRRMLRRNLTLRAAKSDGVAAEEAGLQSSWVGFYDTKPMARRRDPARTEFRFEPSLKILHKEMTPRYTNLRLRNRVEAKPRCGEQGADGAMPTASAIPRLDTGASRRTTSIRDRCITTTPHDSAPVGRRDLLFTQAIALWCLLDKAGPPRLTQQPRLYGSRVRLKPLRAGEAGAVVGDVFQTESC